MNTFKLRNAVLVAAIASSLAACGGGGSAATTPSTFGIGGSAGDGPITGATIKVYDSAGTLVAHTGDQTTTTTAAYNISIPSSTSTPVVIKFTGGMDTVSGLAPDFDLETVATSLSTTVKATANANPMSTLAVQSARIAAGGSATTPGFPAGAATQLPAVMQNIKTNASFGLDQTIDPITTPITATNIAGAMKAYEALGELIRRTASHTAANTTTGFTTATVMSNVIALLAEDLTSGGIDGQVAGTIAKSANFTSFGSQVVGAAQTNAASIALEVVANTLTINDFNDTGGLTQQIAPDAFTAKMNTAAQAIQSNAGAMNAVPVTAEFIAQAKASATFAAAVALAVGGQTTANLTAVNTAFTAMAPGVYTGASLTSAAASAYSTAISTATSAAVAATGSTILTAINSGTTALVSAANFKLASNAPTVTDYPNNFATILHQAAGSTSNGVFTFNLGTLDGANAQKLVNGQTGATPPTINFGLSSLPANSGTNTATVTATILDIGTGTTNTNGNAVRDQGERYVSVSFTVNWSSDGTTLTLTAPPGIATASYYTATSVAAGSVTLNNAAANVLSVTGSGVSGAGATQIAAAITNLMNNAAITTAFNNGVTVTGKTYFYKVNIVGLPLVDQNGLPVSTVQGTFTL